MKSEISVKKCSVMPRRRLSVVLFVIFVVFYLPANSKKLVKQYLANDDICFCDLDTFVAENEMSIDLDSFNMQKLKNQIIDTVQFTENEVRIIFLRPSRAYFLDFNEKNGIETNRAYWKNNGKLCFKYSSFNGLNVGLELSCNSNGEITEMYNSNYLFEEMPLDSVSKIAARYPICWKEAVELLRGKIGDFEPVAMYREKRDTPNKEGMRYYWRFKFETRKGRQLNYYVDAQTGKVKKVMIKISNEFVEDQLF